MDSLALPEGPEVHRPTFWTSQAISGHAVFKAYLHTRARVSSPNRPCAEGNESPEHVMKECRRFAEDRPADWTEIGEHHLRYMTTTTEQLWAIEDTNFRKRRR